MFPVSRIEHERPSYLELAIQDPEKLEGLRQHTDDRARRTVDDHRAHQDVRVGAELPTPETAW